MRFFDGVFTAPRWRALWAAQLGFLLDAMDVLLYVFALATLRTEFGWTNAQAGLAASATLLASAAGGVAVGFLSDRIGRRRTLIYTILLYSLASAGTATSHSLGELIFWRALVGLGLGGEWSAGATLVAEWWPAEHRAKAASFMQSGWALGYMAAAGLTALVLPRWGWRVLFLAGVLPALLTLWIRRSVEEPRVWREQRARAPWNAIFRPPLVRFTVLATTLATSVLFAYWGLFTWLPGFLSLPESEGGAGMTVVRTSGFVFAAQAGAFAVSVFRRAGRQVRKAAGVCVLRAGRGGAGAALWDGAAPLARAAVLDGAARRVLRDRLLLAVWRDAGRAVSDCGAGRRPGVRL